MAEPEWFFSTLAQASAAIAGLIIAFSVVLYQLERERHERRTEHLREELIQFRNKYENIIRTMGGCLADIIVEEETRHLSPGGTMESSSISPTNRIIESHLQKIDKNPKELKEDIEDDNEIEYPSIVYIVAHFSKILTLIQKIKSSNNPRKHYLLTNSQFNVLNDSIYELDRYFAYPIVYYMPEDISEFHTELSEVSDTEKLASRLAPYFDTADDSFTNNLATWIDNNVEGPNDYAEGELSQEFSIEGNTPHSYWIVLNELKQDFSDIDTQRADSILVHSSDISQIIIYSGMLLLVGVFLPIVFLFTLPQPLSGITITGWPLIISQILLLLGSGGITIYLLWLVFENLGTDNG